jgi:hypothetical protein
VEDIISNIELEERIGRGSSICVTPQGFFLSGGKNTLRAGWIYFFDEQRSRFRVDLCRPHFNHASIFFDNLVLVIGGRDSAGALTDCEGLNYRTLKWKHLPPMNIARELPALCTSQERIYVFGGRMSDDNVLDTVEFWENHNWHMAPIKMPVPLYSHAIFVKTESVFLLLGGRTWTRDDSDSFNLNLYSFDIDSN